ncbi:MAG: c-type cytochrome [Geminicoccaceae bacterium]
MRALSMVASLTLLLAPAASAEDRGTASTFPIAAPREIVLPLIDADRGRRLFVAKGCFLCHAVNGTGGIAAPALNAPEGAEQLDPMSFVAGMWSGASAMLELQSLELGYQIELSGEEIADLAAFAASPEAQRTFSMEEIPETMRDWIIEKPYWQGEGWPETFEQEYHEKGLPLDYD